MHIVGISQNRLKQPTLLFLTLLALVLGTVITAHAQFRVSPVKSIGDKITCHVGGESYTLSPNKRLILSTSFAAKYVETQDIFDKVTSYTRLRSNVYTVPVEDDINVEICPGDVNYIAYNADWLKSLYYETNSKWALYAIIAHEIGHYVLAHDRTAVGSDPKIELEADEYAGEILAKMGACLSDAQAAFNSRIMQNQKGESHPSIDKRLAAVKRGWEKVGTICPTPQVFQSQVDQSQVYLKMEIHGQLNTIEILPTSASTSTSTSTSISTSSSTSTSSGSSSSSTSISDSTSGNTRRVVINAQRLTKTIYLEYGKTAEVNLWGQNNKVYISSEIRDRVRINDHGESNEVIIR